MGNPAAREKARQEKNLWKKRASTAKEFGDWIVALVLEVHDLTARVVALEERPTPALVTVLDPGGYPDDRNVGGWRGPAGPESDFTADQLVEELRASARYEYTDLPDGKRAFERAAVAADEADRMLLAMHRNALHKWGQEQNR